MKDGLYLQRDEVAIYKDGKLHAITRVVGETVEFLKLLKKFFPNSNITVLSFEHTDEGKVNKDYPLEG